MLIYYSQTFYIKSTIDRNVSIIPFRKKWKPEEEESWFHATGVIEETELPAKIEDITTRLQNEDPETMRKVSEGICHPDGKNFSGWKFSRVGELRTEYIKDWSMLKAINVLTAKEFGMLMREVITV